jgi:hypothetical protein
MWLVKHVETKKTAVRRRTKAVAQRYADKLNAQHSKSSELIPTAEVVTHIRWLQSQGVGVKTIAKASGVASSVVTRILEGQIARTRRSTAAKLISVGADAVRDGARMRADDTLALVASLVDAGYTRSWIAQELGSSAGGLQVGRSGWISVGKAREIHQLYLRTSTQDANVPRINPTFKIGQPESSLSRRSGSGRKVLAAVGKSVTAPHGTAARARIGCCCKACVRASRVVEVAQSRSGRLRYIARRIGTRWTVLDTVAGTVAFRTDKKAAAFEVAVDLNAKDPRASLTMLVDATPVRRHLQELYSQGTRLTDMARAAGISNAQIIHLLRGRGRRTSAKNASSLLAMSPGEMPTDARIDATPTHLLVDRLQAAGFDTQWLAVVLELPVSALRNRTKRVPLEHARSIAALYSILRTRVPTVELLEKAAP